MLLMQNKYLTKQEVKKWLVGQPDTTSKIILYTTTTETENIKNSRPDSLHDTSRIITRHGNQGRIGYRNEKYGLLKDPEFMLNQKS
jgi:hypothetical protein